MANVGTFPSNKRKFLSDDDEYSPSARLLSIANQIETSCTSKKIRSIEPERIPAPPVADRIDDVDDMMICEDSISKENNTHQMDETTDRSPAMLIPKHCDGICEAEASPTTLMRRCYCDPYRFNALVPYHSDIY